MFDTWLKDVGIEGVEGGDTLVLSVGNAYARDWLADRVTSTASKVLTGVVGCPMQVEFKVSG